LLKGKFNGTIHGGKGRFDGLTVADGETLRFKGAQFPSAICRDFAVPRKQGWKRKEKFERSGGKHSGLSGKSISRD